MSIECVVIWGMALSVESSKEWMQNNSTGPSRSSNQSKGISSQHSLKQTSSSISTIIVITIITIITIIITIIILIIVTIIIIITIIIIYKMEVIAVE